MSRSTKGLNVRLTALERLHLLKLLQLNQLEGLHDGDEQRWWERTGRIVDKLRQGGR